MPSYQNMNQPGYYAMPIDEKLYSWVNLEINNWPDLLLGNGFSINIHDKFSYKSLMEVACLSAVNKPLSEVSRSLFKEYKTDNFEDILRFIHHSLVVDRCAKLGRSAELTECYLNVREALASAVNHAHISCDNLLGLEKISKCLRSFKRVFTTNYDFIPYWSINAYNVRAFRDFMWGDEGHFDINNTELWTSVTALYFLHGGLHLYEDIENITRKRRANNLGSIRELFDYADLDRVPLIVGEGDSSRKMMRINSNSYLSFCYDAFAKSNSDLLVLGHSLHADYDKHLVEAIGTSMRKRVAISVWPGLEKDQIISFKARINQSLSRFVEYIHYFDSTTHPLTSGSINRI